MAPLLLLALYVIMFFSTSPLLLFPLTGGQSAGFAIDFSTAERNLDDKCRDISLSFARPYKMSNAPSPTAYRLDNFHVGTFVSRSIGDDLDGAGRLGRMKG